MWSVYDKTGTIKRCVVEGLSYNGTFMGESYVSFNFNSPFPVSFEVGDYLEYRGERFVLNYTPSAVKNSNSMETGNAFEYRDVKMNSIADELTRCDFLDVVLADNHVHFTSLSKFSFYAATVKDLADRIQANLNRLYNGEGAWTVTVEEDVAVKDKSLSVDNINCWEALSLVNSDFDANFVISGRTIRIGTAGISVGTVFGYGKGNGLINIEQSTNNDSLIVTRLRAYGSTRNIPYRYYNNLKDSNGTPLIPESMYVNTLMLPGFAENGGDAYVDSPNITRIGIREKSVYFDGSGELPEIYPSIEGMTAEELKAAGINVNATGRIDEVVSAEQMTDDGIIPEDKEELDKKTFTITLKDIGFNPVDKKHLTTETPFISMKTGMCGGREFEITGCEEKGNNYILTCNREMDSSINKAFPNNPYQVSAGDQFVFIGIAMDDIYIKAAEQRLLTAAKDYLSNNDKSKYTYLPKIDKVFMARHPEIASSLKEGNILDFKDTDLGIDVSVIIQSLVIKEGGPVPEYEITLFNDKVVSTIEKIQNSITSLASNTGITIEQAKSLFATWVEAWRVKWFDQKLHTYDPVKFNSVTSPLFIFNELTTPEFVSGLLGAGTRLKDNHLELDEITVRKRMNVFELFIQRVRAVGGQLLLSPASIKISTVEELENGYKCSFNTDDQTIPEPFVLNDQAFHQTFTGKGINRYWRLTTEAGDDYFVLSKTDCEPGSGIPQPGDEVILLGNRTDKARQSAMMLSAYGNDAPYLDTYDGINDYNLSGKLLTREGNLTGIVDEVFGQLSGSGFYGKNVYLRGKFALSSGVSVDDKFGQTDSQMNNLQGQLTNQQGQLNTQQGQITNIQTDILAIPGQIKQEVSQTVTHEVGNLKIGMVNLLKGSNVELNARSYLLGIYYFDKKPEVGKTYTLTICYTIGENNTYIGAYQDGGNYSVSKFETKGDKIIESKTFKYSAPSSPNNMSFYQFPNGAYGSKVHWAVLVEGNKGPNAWIPSLSEQGETAAKNEMNNLQIGGINLADYSGGNFLNALGLYDSSYASKTTIDGKTCLQFNRNSANCRFAPVTVENGEYTFSIWVKGSEEYDAQVHHYDESNYGETTVHVTTSWERKVITFTAKAGTDIIHFGTKNTIYIADWKYEKGNKATDWSPSIADQNRYATEQGIIGGQDAVDNLQIGSVNLVSRKMMLAWNNKKDGIAVWGQDSDGIYLSINPALLYNNTGNGTEDIFLGENKYKANTQYVFSIDWKTSTTESTDKVGLTVYVAYTDGSSASLLRASNQQTTKKRTDYITEKGKTIRKIFNSYGYGINCRIYSLALYEGNKVLAEPPVATEDLTGQSNVNLLDNSKFQFGTEGYFPNQQATLNVVDGVLQVRSSKTSSTPGVQFPVVHLHPGVYTIKMRAKGINISSCHCYVYKDGTSDRVGVDGISISPVFSGISFTFAVSIEHDYKIYWMWSASTAASYPAGIDIEYSMLTAGDIAPQDWNPSPGDVAKDIKDVSDAVTSLQNFTDQAFADGIVTRSEAQAIASNINVLNAEKADIDAYYNKLYANAYLTGTAKTNLASAKTAYNTAHTNLINSINTAIADGKATATEKADVDAKFTAYNNALSAYQTRVGEADKAIQDTIKKVADDAQTSANTAQSAANAAQSAANQAQADAKTANDKLKTWASDNYISPQEKTALRQQKSDIQSEQKDIEANANRYGISLASYMAAYNAAMAALNKYTATSPENIAVGSDYNNIAAYYTARQTILNSIAAAAKAQVDGVVDTIDKVTTEFNTKIDQKADSVTVSAMRTDLNSLGQVVNQQGSQLQVNTNSIDAIVTKNGSGTIVSIKPEMVEITGATVIKDGNGNKVNIFGVGDKVISVNGGVFSVDKAGKVIMQNAEITGKITAKTGEIGSFTIDGIWLKGSELRISGSQITFENGNNQVYLNSHPDMATGGAVKLGTFVLTGGSYNGLESARAVALIAAAPSDNYSCAIAVTSGRVLMKGQIHFDNVVTYTGSGAVTITADSGHFIYLTPITGNPVVSVSSGLPIGSWFIIAHATTAGGFYYIKLSGSDRFRRRGNAYQQVNSNNQDPSLIFKVNNTTWVIGNLPVNWIDWN